jgi:putative membrane-bound dehydrogenase-like protein
MHMPPKSFLGLLLLALVAVLPGPLRAQPAADWQAIQVPGAWQTNGPAAARNFHGIAWYRTWVKPHDTFFARHERNIYEESAGIHVRDLADAHELFLNGRKLGSGGGFPPAFKSGRAEIHRHKIPVGALRKGEWNEIAIRVYNASGPGGFLGEAPFIMNYFMEAVLEGPWEFHLGDAPNLAGPAVVAKPARSAFDSFHESHRVLGRSSQLEYGDRMSPADSLKQMTAAEDLVVEQILAEPTIAQPVNFSFDERGRLWIAQYRQYPYPAGLNMLSRDKYYRAHYDRIPPAPPNHDRGADIISVHESTQRGGVWVMHTPYLLFYPDRNGDDVPDGPPEVKLAGFGLEDTHSVANGLVWGMDGWLYGGQGSTTSSHVKRPGIDPPDFPGVPYEGCTVWRYHPESRAYEIFAEGSGNTFGLEVDAQGRLYSGHNGGTTRGWYYVQGGYYLKQGADPGKYGPQRNPYTFGELPMLKTDTTVVRFSHFAAFAEGTALPHKYLGQLFSIDPLHNVVIASDRRTMGATFATADNGPVLNSKDVAFRPVYIANAPDGSLFISDMYEYYIAHGQHYQNQIDPTTGRVYRLRGKNSKLETDLNLLAKSTDQLIALLSHPNKWHRHTAVRVLGERKDPAATLKLRHLIVNSGPAMATGSVLNAASQVADYPGTLGALNALWALHQSAGLDEATALQALRHSYPPVRAWTARLLGDEWGVHPGLGTGVHAAARRPAPGTLPPALFQALVAQCKVDANPEALAQYASTARRLNPPQAMPLVAAVMAHSENVKDPYLPLLCWWVFESHLPGALSEIVALFQDRALWDLPIVAQEVLPRLARRLAVEGKRQELLALAQLFRAAPSPRHASLLLPGVEEAFRGRAVTGLPEELVAAIAATGRAPLVFRLKQGDAAAVSEALKILQDPKAKPGDRLLYARTFGEVNPAGALPVLLSVASSAGADALRKAALASLSSYNDPSVGAQVAALVPGLTGEVQTAAFTLLASRPAWSLKLLDTLQAGKLKAAAVPADVADRLRSSKDPSVQPLAARLLPKAVAMAPEFQKRITEVEGTLKRGAGNPYAGEPIFMERCAGCHKLFHKGGSIGPELSHYQRDNLGTMLISIINPNAEIREGFQYYSVETTDGRSLSGFFVDRDSQVTVLRGLEGENFTLRASEIKDLQPMGRSLMPEGLLEGLDEKQLRDLFAYLRIAQPISK